MGISSLERIRAGLIEKRQHLLRWLRTTPPQKQHALLGPVNVGAVQAHIQMLDTSLDKTAAETFGQCAVCHDPIEPELLELDYTCCVCLADLSSEDQRLLENELELAQRVQRALLPQHVPTIQGIDLAVFSRPAQIVGGDYFDFCQFQDGTYGIVIADVAGHGMAASLLMASLQAALRTLIPTSTSPAGVLQQLNRFFAHNVHFTTFVTLFLGQYDPAERLLTYGNAGHNPPLLQRGKSDRELLWLTPTAPAIGLVDEFQATTATIQLAPDDVLVLYTDGVTDAINPQREEFGQEAIARVLEKERGPAAKYLIQTLRASLQEHTQEQPLADDITIMIGRVTE